MRHGIALQTAEALVEHLRPACVRIEIAGSIRRLKPEVKDIEIVAIPDLSLKVTRAPLKFGEPIPELYKTALDKALGEMKALGDIQFEKAGERYKKFYLKYAGISVDLFLVLPPATWGVQMLIRTGPADFSHWMVSRQKTGGALPNGYRVQDGAVWIGEHEDKEIVDGHFVGFETEKEFLSFCGFDWIPPEEREAKWKR